MALHVDKMVRNNSTSASFSGWVSCVMIYLTLTLCLFKVMEDACMWEFTRGQIVKMERDVKTYRPTLMKNIYSKWIVLRSSLQWPKLTGKYHNNYGKCLSKTFPSLSQTLGCHTGFAVPRQVRNNINWLLLLHHSIFFVPAFCHVLMLIQRFVYLFIIGTLMGGEKHCES